ncbi:MAG: FAD-dependent oxidoreductase [Ilumatobacteraceae bacterium]
MNGSADVVVVGAGPCGLASALLAARRGMDVLIVEAADHVGGMAASIDVGGQRVDLGSHRLHPSAPPSVRALLDDLLGSDVQVRTRHGRLHLAGRPGTSRWVGFPLRAPDLVRNVPIGVGARIAADLATGPLRRRRSTPDGSYAAFVRAGLGPTALAMFHGPMATKLWGRAPEDLSSELARRRISINGGSRMLTRIARGSRPSGRTFLYPRLGYGEVVDRLAERAAASGAAIVTGHRIAALAPGAEPVLDLDDGTTVQAGRVLWTAPLDALGALLGHPTTRVVHRGLVLVYLVVDEDRYSLVDAHYVPDPGVAFARLSEPKNYRDGPDPAGRTVLCAELPATVGDDVWADDDDGLAALVLDGMDAIGLRRPPILDAAVRRLPRVYPVLGPGDDARDRALGWADGLTGVSVLGRQGRHVADNLHHVLDMAIAADGCLAPGSWDDARWAAECRRFDAFVVDD